MKCGSCVLPLLIVLVGCATHPTGKKSNTSQGPAAIQPELTGDLMVDGPNFIANGAPRDRVLWEYRTALAAFRRGNLDVARKYLDDALRTLEGAYGPNAEARKSRGYFSPEAKKTFIGEPYERSMAYIYRGLIYWNDGELDNARACFRSAEFEDSDTQNKQYAGDWILPDYLDGLATAKLGGDGSDAVKRAQARIRLPPLDAHANCLIVAEFGLGPGKLTTGDYREQLRFRVPHSPVHSAVLTINDQRIPISACDDVGFQATTRGGRVMDHVLANKVVFKTTTAAAGELAMLGGLATALASGNKTAQEVGIGVAAVGAVVEIISALTKPAADDRAWDNLPRFLGLGRASVVAGEHPATVEFLDETGNMLLTKALTINIHSNRQDELLFFSDRNDRDQPPRAGVEPGKIAERLQKARTSFAVAASQLQERGVSRILALRADTDLSKAQAALLRSISSGDIKWRVMESASPDPDSIQIRMIGKSFLGAPRRAVVQLCQIADNDTEIRARLMVLPITDADLARPDIVAELNQFEGTVCSMFVANLKRELGSTVRQEVD